MLFGKLQALQIVGGKPQPGRRISYLGRFRLLGTHQILKLVGGKPQALKDEGIS